MAFVTYLPAATLVFLVLVQFAEGVAPGIISGPLHMGVLWVMGVVLLLSVPTKTKPGLEMSPEERPIDRQPQSR